jgi:hypothetical protein
MCGNLQTYASLTVTNKHNAIIEFVQANCLYIN